MNGLRSPRSAILLTVAVVSMTGCAADHRISVAEFLDMEQRAREQAAQPMSDEQREVVASLVERQLGPYRIGPSDVLTITVTTNDVVPPFEPLLVRVDETGSIDLPLVVPVSVLDKTLEEAERAVKEAYAPSLYAEATVHVDTTVPDVTLVVVRGAVTLPGMVPLRRTERNLLFAVVGAGGVTSASSGKVTLRRLRRPGEELTLDLTDPREVRAALSLDPLEAGDMIDVHAAFPNIIFVGGLVNAPHSIPFDPGVEVNILQAIAASGGLRTDVTPAEATLTRRLADGRDAHVKLLMAQIESGEQPNFILKPGDILWVPQTTLTIVQDFINRNIFLRAGVSVNYNVSGVEYMNRASQQSQQFGGTSQSNAFDPLGFLGRNAALNTLTNAPPVIP